MYLELLGRFKPIASSEPIRRYGRVMSFHTLLKLKVLVPSLAALVTCVALVVPGYSPGRAPPLHHRGKPSLQVESTVAMSSCASPAVYSATDAPRDAWQAVEGLAEVSPRYDAFIIDQWGVMHDGNTPYPGAVECINYLAAAGKKIAKGAALTKLQRMGFSTDGILDVVTSGEIAWEGLRQRAAEPFKSLGKKCLVFGNGDDDLEYLSSCGCTLAEAEDADFILARGSFVIIDSQGTRRYSPTIMSLEGNQETQKAMATMLERGAKMLVTNPDFLRPGTNDPMPGLIGRAYADMGGTVHYVGKPHSLVYEACFNALREHMASEAGEHEDHSVTLDPSTIAAVGDSLDHDILGALRNGIGSVFIAGGVHFEELGVAQGAGDVPNDEGYSAAFAKHLGEASMPTYVVPGLRW